MELLDNWNKQDPGFKILMYMLGFVFLMVMVAAVYGSITNPEGMKEVYQMWGMVK